VPNAGYRRFTDLPSLIQILTARKLTLLDPASWDDKNDSLGLAKYKEKMALKSVLALCFTASPQTYHHWRAFSSGASGVCIDFEGAALEASFRTVKGVQFKAVTYLSVRALSQNAPKLSSLPFTKRAPYHAEHEYRALWQSESETLNSLDIPINLAAITRITLSPWMHKNLKKSVSSLIKSIKGCSDIDVRRSTIVSNAQWGESLQAAIDGHQPGATAGRA
jgi:hypothetical protein